MNRTEDEQAKYRLSTTIVYVRTRVEFSALKTDRSDLNRYLLGYSPTRVPYYEFPYT